LDKAPFFPNPELGNFGIFLDSAPDRWGQTLMMRREALEARDQERTPRTLHAWDFLIGVQDLTRQGALRFRLEGTGEFLAAHRLPAPPVTSLRELESVARELSNKTIDDLKGLRHWLSVLVAPGASLGGARPKANFTDTDQSLWIAKFPARDDNRDIGAWESVAHTLATQAGIAVPAARLMKLGEPYRTFCVKRFDRHGGKRVFYASAMTLLQRDQSEGASYLDLAHFIQHNGATPACIAADLTQLFRRVVFNVAVGNRDDHLRNHGFLLTRSGWRLAPAFDVNPNIAKTEHVLSLDDSDNRPDLATVASTAEFYGITKTQARVIMDEVLKVAGGWKKAAAKARISAAEILLFEPAFAAQTA
jgi:serine/threonine-protein kinase HipA